MTAGRMPQATREKIYHRNMHALYRHVRNELKARYGPWPVPGDVLTSRLKEEAARRGFTPETPGGRSR